MDLAGRLKMLGMDEYLYAFEAQSFDSWASVLDITEKDLIALGVDLGHRRKLQRAIATERGHNLNLPLQQDEQELPAFLQCRKSSDASDDDGTGSASMAASHISDQSTADADATTQNRRRYRRRVHQRDPTRPERPLTGYVRFSRDQHKCYRHKKWSFAQLAKQIGEDWRDLDPNRKEAYLRAANREWDRYRKIMEQLKLEADIQSPLAMVDARSLAAVDGRMSNVDLAGNMSTFQVLSSAHQLSDLTPPDPRHVHSPIGIANGYFYLANGFPGEAPCFHDQQCQHQPALSFHAASLGSSLEHGPPSNYSWAYGPSTPRTTADEMPAYSSSLPPNLKYEDSSTSASSSDSQGAFSSTPAMPDHAAARHPRPPPANIWNGATSQQHHHHPPHGAPSTYQDHARHQHARPLWDSAAHSTVGPPLPIKTPDTPDSTTSELGVA